MIIKNVHIYTDGAFSDGCVGFDERIHAVVPMAKADGALDGEGCWLIPGLVDIHTHAAMGEDASDGSVEGLEKMSRYYAAGGVTSWCPTTMTLSEEELTRAMEAIREFSGKRPGNGAKVAGVNLEGPFLSRAKCGAQNPDFLRAPDIGLFHRLNEASGGKIRLVTVAPELEGAVEFIREASKACVVSLGHTTADYNTAVAAFQAGARHVTHLYNAMPPLQHRAPGVIGAAADAGATVELIADGFHSHPAVVRLTQRLFREKLVLISDSARCAGMPDGEYELGGQPITLKNGKATLTGTDTIAGSSIHLMDGLRRAVRFGVPLETAVAAATIAPARVIGRDGFLGSIAPGKCADFVLLDTELNVRAVFIDGLQVAGEPLK